MVLSTAIRIPLTHNKASVAVDQNVVAGCVATFVEIADVDVSFFTKTNPSAVWLVRDGGVLTIVTLSIFFHAEFDIAAVVESFKFSAPIKEIVRQTVQLLRSFVKRRFFFN